VYIYVDSDLLNETAVFCNQRCELLAKFLSELLQLALTQAPTEYRDGCVTINV